MGIIRRGSKTYTPDIPSALALASTGASPPSMTNLRPHEVENTFLVASSQILVVPEVEKIKHGYQDTI